MKKCWSIHCTFSSLSCHHCLAETHTCLLCGFLAHPQAVAWQWQNCMFQLFGSQTVSMCVWFVLAAYLATSIWRSWVSSFLISLYIFLQLVKTERVANVLSLLCVFIIGLLSQATDSQPLFPSPMRMWPLAEPLRWVLLTSFEWIACIAAVSTLFLSLECQRWWVSGPIFGHQFF